MKKNFKKIRYKHHHIIGRIISFTFGPLSYASLFIIVISLRYESRQDPYYSKRKGKRNKETKSFRIYQKIVLERKTNKKTFRKELNGII